MFRFAQHEFYDKNKFFEFVLSNFSLWNYAKRPNTQPNRVLHNPTPQQL